MSDLVLYHDSSVGSLSQEQQNRCSLCVSFLDYLLLDNGLEAPSNQVTFVIKPDYLPPGYLAVTEPAGYYKFNSRGKLVLDGEWPVTIRLAINNGLASWPDTYMKVILLHEMLHALGFVEGVFQANGNLATSGQYIGHALAAYEMEVPNAPYIPLIGDHLNALDPKTLMHWSLQYPGVGIRFPYYVLQMVKDNGWEVNGKFGGGLISELLPPGRRSFPNEDGITINN